MKLRRKVIKTQKSAHEQFLFWKKNICSARQHQHVRCFQIEVIIILFALRTTKKRYFEIQGNSSEWSQNASLPSAGRLNNLSLIGWWKITCNNLTTPKTLFPIL